MPRKPVQIATAGDFELVDEGHGPVGTGVMAIRCLVCGRQQGGGTPSVAWMFWRSMSADALPRHDDLCERSAGTP